MRRGELLALKWERVDFVDRTVYLPNTKTGKPRSVPLSPRALGVLLGLRLRWEQLKAERSGSDVIPLSAEGLKSVFQRARLRANLEHVNFHDLRHEATSRLFEGGWGIMEVAAVTGHADLKSLKRYTNLRASDLSKKMASLPTIM
ncbi:shufflon-specific DNA recombinase [alpha proteobacterium Q-1]|nr:shufflon-specific DNA recombinase [alpha proteobacterium Q-1]